MSAKSRIFLASLCVTACLATIPVPQVMASGISVSEENSGIVPMMEYIAGADYDFSVSNDQAIPLAWD